jgi:uncharacterized RDD family membrane protein YckC
VEYEDRHVTATPEGIRLDVVLAGLGSRFAAYAFDFLFQVLAFILFAVIVHDSVGPNESEATVLIVEGAYLVFALLDFLLYFVIFDMLFSGRSPGKRLAGLRVVRVGGQPVGFLASLLRNLFRVVDFLPFVYTFGSVLILATSRNQRLGDLAAGTVVIRDRVSAEQRVSPYSFASGAGFVAPAGSHALGRQRRAAGGTVTRTGVSRESRGLHAWCTEPTFPPAGHPDLAVCRRPHCAAPSGGLSRDGAAGEGRPRVNRSRGAVSGSVPITTPRSISGSITAIQANVVIAAWPSSCRA